MNADKKCENPCDFLSEWFSIPECRYFYILLPWTHALFPPRGDNDLQLVSFKCMDDYLLIETNSDHCKHPSDPKSNRNTRLEFFGPIEVLVNQDNDLHIRGFKRFVFDSPHTPWSDEGKSGSLVLRPSIARRNLSFPTIKPIYYDREVIKRDSFPGLKSIIDSNKTG